MAFEEFKFGHAAHHIPPPPSQAIATNLFRLGDKWDLLKPVLATNQEEEMRHVKHDATSPQTAEMFSEFSAAWNNYLPAGTAAERMTKLQGLYATDEKEMLDSVPGPESYHAVHRKWHPIYRQLLYDNHYYDIFVFDLKGDMIYSVYKELDYATNFAKNGTGKWKDSGLGEAFEAAKAQPDIVSYVDWKPYGPSAGALAAFLATG